MAWASAPSAASGNVLHNKDLLHNAYEAVARTWTMSVTSFALRATPASVRTGSSYGRRASCHVAEVVWKASSQRNQQAEATQNPTTNLLGKRVIEEGLKLVERSCGESCLIRSDLQCADRRGAVYRRHVCGQALLAQPQYHRWQREQAKSAQQGGDQAPTRHAFTELRHRSPASRRGHAARRTQQPRQPLEILLERMVRTGASSAPPGRQGPQPHSHH